MVILFHEYGLYKKSKIQRKNPNHFKSNELKQLKIPKKPFKIKTFNLQCLFLLYLICLTFGPALCLAYNIKIYSEYHKNSVY